MDPQQRIFLETVWKTIEDAGYRASDLSGTKTGLFVGVSTSDYTDLLKASPSAMDPHASTGNAHSILANRISYQLNLCGPSEPIDTACSSSLVAVHRAVEAIRSGACETAIAGGVNVVLSPTVSVAFGLSQVLAEDGRCKTFAKRADGYVRGEGAGAIFLKPLSRAKADGDHIHALILGSAVSHSGRSHSLTTPNAKAQTRLLIEAYQEAQVGPDTVGYIEAHGTGTSIGDLIEFKGLSRAFGELYRRRGKTVPGELQLRGAAQIIAYLLDELSLDVDGVVGRSEVDSGVVSPGAQWLQGAVFKDMLTDLVQAIRAGAV